MNYKDYFYSLRFFILFSLLVFIFAIISSYILAQNSPQKSAMVLEDLKRVYGPVVEMSSLEQFFFIFLKNGLTLLLVLLLGIIFGIFPFLVLLSNGSILGIIAFFFKENLSWSVFFVGFLPHGIIEIPVLILTCAIGLKIGKTAFLKVFKKQGEVKKEISYAFSFSFKFLLPLLALAAAIEVFITSQLLRL